MNQEMQALVDLLHREACSCVVRNDTIRMFGQRGVADLYDMLITMPSMLCGADVADKVVGKGAAALMILGRVRQVYADVISSPAYDMLKDAGIDVTYDILVPGIRNRSGSGWCPVETLCRDCATAEECLPLITGFVKRQRGAGEETE